MKYRITCAVLLIVALVSKFVDRSLESKFEVEGGSLVPSEAVKLITYSLALEVLFYVMICASLLVFILSFTKRGQKRVRGRKGLKR
jgi:hypothetical protein